MYLVSNMSQQEINEEGWEECCHTRRNNGNRRPGITTKEIIGDRSSGESLWVPPRRRPSVIERKKMTARMVEIGLVQVMTNNVYKFGGDIRIQKEGGAIGVRATGDVAKAVMVDWDSKFNERLEKILTKPLLYKRFLRR